MEQVRISDIITSEYSDFLSYCSSSGKIFISDLTKVDFVAFRTISGQTREYIEKIKTMLANPAFMLDNHVFIPDDIKEPNNETTQEDDVTEAPVDTAEDESDYFYVEGVVDANKGSDKADADLFSEDKETMSSAEYTEPFSFEISSSERQNTLAQLFGVDVSLFENVEITELDLGRRSSNCMNKEGITTVAGVLSKTVDGLQLIRNMGEKSIREIFQKTKEFVSYFLSDSDNLSMSYQRKKNKNNRLTPEIKNAVEAILLGDEYSFDNIEADKLNDLAKIKEAVEISGAEICLETYLNPDYSAAISVALSKFAKPYIEYCSAKREAAQKMACLSESVCQLNVVPFIRAYSATKRNDEIVLLLSECDNNTKVKDIPILIEKVRQDKNKITLAAEINRLLKWLNFDVAALASDITEKMRSSFSEENERTLEAFVMQSKGKTLLYIGELFGITRERARQICNKVHTKFWELYRRQKYDLIMLVYALKQEDGILFFDDLKEILGDEFTEILWHCLKYNPKHDFYFYSKEFEAIVIKENEAEHYDEDILRFKIEDLLASLPEVIEIHKDDEILTYLANLAANNSVPIILLKNKFDKVYKRTNSFYYRGRITNAFMYEYVFKNRFRAGYKIADAYDEERFSRYMTEIFGENAKVNGVTSRAIDAQVCRMGVLCDRAKYIHPDYMQVDKKLIDGINDYIETSPRSILFYSEIFKAMKNELEGSQITNKYLLQGALKKYGCKYNTSRDCIRKVPDITIEDELEAFMEERGIVHKSEILAEFQFWTDSELYKIMRKSANVFYIDGGYFIHTNQFDIQPEDYDLIREYLTQTCMDIPVSIDKIYEDFSEKFPDFLYRNDFDDKSKFFAALNYMFREEFRFTKPYIARIGSLRRDITRSSVTLQHIKSFDTIEIENLVDICNENNIRYTSIANLVMSLAPDYIRISRTKLMKRELTGITDEIIDEAVNNVKELIETNGYIAGSKVTDFLWFPEINVDWNGFLLENLMLQSKKIGVIFLGVRASLKYINTIYVSDVYRTKSYEDFLVEILRDEVHKGTFTSKTEMRDWLKEEGLIEVNMPNFLESSEYFYVDKTGVHCKGE